VLSLALAAVAGAAGAPEAASDLDAWRADVTAWIGGDDGRVLAWSQHAPAAVLRLRPRAARLAAEGPPAFMRAALRLHILAGHHAGLQGRTQLWQAHQSVLDALLAHLERTAAAQDAGGWRELRRAATLAKGYNLLMRGRPTPAKQAFDAQLARTPEDPDALLGLALSEELRATVAALLPERYIASDELIAAGTVPDHFFPARQTIAREVDGSLRNSRSALERALRAGAPPAPVHLRLGRLAAHEQLREKAEQAWRLALETARGDEACLAHLMLARAAEERRERGEALEHYRAAVAAAPHARSARLALSAALGRSGDRGGALRELQAVIEHDAVAGAGLDDPWLRYQFEPGDGPRRLFAALSEAPR
jgi:tetratricopeptide (TPR) repeat protein